MNHHQMYIFTEMPAKKNTERKYNISTNPAHTLIIHNFHSTVMLPFKAEILRDLKMFCVKCKITMKFNFISDCRSL